MTAKLAAERPVALEVRVRCTTCQAPLHLLGPVRAVRCGGCGHDKQLSPSLWHDLLAEADEQSFDGWGAAPVIAIRRRDTPSGNLLARWQSLSPACPSCRGPVQLVEVGSETNVTCGECGRGVPTRPVPGFIRLELGTAMQCYAAAPDALAVVGGADVFACPRCGQDCALGDEDSVRCSACSSVVSATELLGQSPLRLERVFWITFQGAPPRVSARLSRVKLDIATRSANAPSLLHEAVSHTIERVAQEKRDRYKPLLLLLLLVGCVFGAMAYWRYYTKRSQSDDFTFDPRSSE
jgi:hypothetical protein